MTVDFARLDAELESLRVDQIAVARGMLAAREWAGADLQKIDEALGALADGGPVATPARVSLPAVDLATSLEPEAAAEVAEPAAQAAEPAPLSSSPIDVLFDDAPLELGGDADAPLAGLGDSLTADLASELEGDDDILEVEELEILEDDILITD